MSFPDNRDVYELERALGNLASNPRVPPAYRNRLSELQSALGARRLARDNQLLTDRDLDRFELLMARVQIAVRARKQELELQLKQYDERDKRVAQVLDAIEDHRKKRQETGSEKVARSGSSRRRTRSQRSSGSQ